MNARIVLIAGGTASGKSTIARKVSETTGAAHLMHDRYYFDVPDPREHNYDHPDALDTDLLVQHVQAMKAGNAVGLPVYDFKTHRRQQTLETIHPQPVVVIEGILVLSHPGLRELADLRVYVDCADDIRLARRIQRDQAQRGRSADDVLRQYFATVRPMHQQHVAPAQAHADLVLSGEGDLDGTVRTLTERISMLIQQ